MRCPDCHYENPPGLLACDLCHGLLAAAPAAALKEALATSPVAAQGEVAATPPDTASDTATPPKAAQVRLAVQPDSSDDLPTPPDGSPAVTAAEADPEPPAESPLMVAEDAPPKKKRGSSRVLAAGRPRVVSVTPLPHMSGPLPPVGDDLLKRLRRRRWRLLRGVLPLCLLGVGLLCLPMVIQRIVDGQAAGWSLALAWLASAPAALLGLAIFQVAATRRLVAKGLWLKVKLRVESDTRKLDIRGGISWRRLFAPLWRELPQKLIHYRVDSAERAAQSEAEGSASPESPIHGWSALFPDERPCVDDDGYGRCIVDPHFPTFNAWLLSRWS